MKKNIVYIVLLAVLGAGVWYFLFSDKNVFGVNEADFTVKDTNAVYRIYLADKMGNAVTLERKEQGWMLDNKYPVLPSSLGVLMKTMATQEAMYPVPENMHNSVIKNMAAKAIKVELYNKKGDPMQVFYVGGQVGENAGSYMLMEGASKPYVVQIPGFEGYLSPRYSTKVADWRDRTVFNAAPENIQSVSVTYPSEPLNSFVLNSVGKEKFEVKIDPALAQTGTFNERRATVYAGYFQNINLEGYLNGLPGLDTMIAAAKKRCTVELVTKDGKKQLVDIYWKPLGKRSKNLDVQDPDIPEGFDADRFYAVFNNQKDTAIIQRATFDKMFRRSFEFYMADQQPATAADTLPGGSVKIPVH
ncbi:DUF4340 domain-containing protein [Polluticoccus soli]|uniref:DUF4340 domain-containing protein n=1 Tax=Polluticoccus soli TaxID=3034150 RepID=UPI0023E0E01B|nr:DUF4340 domain-containing protein [Flavipsychrobacter sp. JY13-12]